MMKLCSSLVAMFCSLCQEPHRHASILYPTKTEGVCKACLGRLLQEPLRCTRLRTCTGVRVNGTMFLPHEKCVWVWLEQQAPLWIQVAQQEESAQEGHTGDISLWLCSQCEHHCIGCSETFCADCHAFHWEAWSAININHAFPDYDGDFVADLADFPDIDTFMAGSPDYDGDTFLEEID